MKYAYKYILISLLGAILSAVIVLNTEAHMMVAQHGTINVVGDAAFMVVSLPVSAFEGVDDDKDGKLSMTEFTTHHLDIIKQVKNGVTFNDGHERLVIQGVMLKPAISHHKPKEPVSQLIVMGRFTLVKPTASFDVSIELFGNIDKEKRLEMTATRKVDNKVETFDVTPKLSKHNVFTDAS